jgi:hypothetical protein
VSDPGIDPLIQELAAFPGVQGCALVEADTGMVWYHSRNFTGIEQIGESAIEFWRIQLRLAENFSAFGPLQSTAYAFANRVVALFPCSDKPALVLVCVAAKTGVAWAEWGQQVQALKKKLA